MVIHGKNYKSMNVQQPPNCQCPPLRLKYSAQHHVLEWFNSVSQLCNLWYNTHSIIRGYVIWHRGTDSKFVRWHLTSVGPVWNLLHVTLLADKILRWLFDVMIQIFINFLSFFLSFFFFFFFSLSSSSASPSFSRVTTLSYGSSFPLQSSPIPPGLWPLYANFSYPLSIDPLQPHHTISSVIYLFPLLLSFWQSLFVLALIRIQRHYILCLNVPSQKATFYISK